MSDPLSNGYKDRARFKKCDSLINYIPNGYRDRYRKGGSLINYLMGIKTEPGLRKVVV